MARLFGSVCWRRDDMQTPEARVASVPSGPQAGHSGRQAPGWPLLAAAWALRGSRARAGSRDARTPRATVRTRIMAMAMKISPSVRAADADLVRDAPAHQRGG